MPSFLKVIRSRPIAVLVGRRLGPPNHPSRHGVKQVLHPLDLVDHQGLDL